MYINMLPSQFRQYTYQKGLFSTSTMLQLVTELLIFNNIYIYFGTIHILLSLFNGTIHYYHTGIHNNIEK